VTIVKVDITMAIILSIKPSLIHVFLALRSIPILVSLVILMAVYNVILQSNSYLFSMELVIIVLSYWKVA
jgi:hypothetical protein